MLTEHIGTWLAASLVALLTIFSDKILGRIRLSLNRVDLRTKYFEELAIDLSTYIFYAEVYCERFQRGWLDDLDDLKAVAGEVNRAVTTLRSKEYVYRSWVRKYWGVEAAQRFSDLMHAVKSVDAATHAFNDRGKREEKVAQLERELGNLRVRLEGWLSQPT